MWPGSPPGVASFPAHSELIPSPGWATRIHRLRPALSAPGGGPTFSLTPSPATPPLAYYPPAAPTLNPAISFSLGDSTFQNVLPLALCRAGFVLRIFLNIPFSKRPFLTTLSQIPLTSLRADTTGCHHAFMYLLCLFSVCLLD